VVLTIMLLEKSGFSSSILSGEVSFWRQCCQIVSPLDMIPQCLGL